MATYHNFIGKHSAAENVREMSLAKVEIANKQQLAHEWGSAACTHGNYPVEKYTTPSITSVTETSTQK